jgi:acetylornithine deacetylase/succinyl-diaminopimelate desuccinylase-like protein
LTALIEWFSFDVSLWAHRSSPIQQRSKNRRGFIPPMKQVHQSHQDRWIASALEHINDSDNRALLASIVNIPSPTGEESRLAEYLGGVMRRLGLDVTTQAIDLSSANVIGALGSDVGPSLILYSPLDSAFSGNADEEVPWVGPKMRPDLLPEAVIDGDRLIGLSANNPKAHIVSIVAAAGAIAKAGIPLVGKVVLAFGAGGAPSNRERGPAHTDFGHGAGCEYMLQQGLRGDFAIITKPGYAVSWQEAGLAWFQIRIHGVHTYVGQRLVLADDNPIVRAASVIQTLERWFKEYTERHTSDFVSPLGAVSAIKGGWTSKLAFIPAACDLYVDLRIDPRSSPEQARLELEECLDRECRANGARIDCSMIVAIPGQTTDPHNWIVKSCIAAWEATEGRKHEPLRHTSGQTEAVILRRHGIPTARVGLPGITVPENLVAEDGRPVYTMGVVDLPSVRKLSECLVRAIVDTCTRSRQEVGLTKATS